ncbi:MAG TPA: hypothetical protein VFQ86_12315, partial [Arachidicoccus soli]|nr:hypothetical protein [Arachidicoccus soli]
HVSALPAASFRFPVTRDTFAVRLIVPLTGPIGIFHPLEMHHAGRTIIKTCPNETGFYRIVNIQILYAFLRATAFSAASTI